MYTSKTLYFYVLATRNGEQVEAIEAKHKQDKGGEVLRR